MNKRIIILSFFIALALTAAAQPGKFLKTSNRSHQIGMLVDTFQNVASDTFRTNIMAVAAYKPFNWVNAHNNRAYLWDITNFRFNHIGVDSVYVRPGTDSVFIRLYSREQFAFIKTAGAGIYVDSVYARNDTLFYQKNSTEYTVRKLTDVETVQDAVGAMINASLQYIDGTPLLAINDRDFGDITTSGEGLIFTIDQQAVTYDKIQNVSGINVLLGRMFGSGTIEELNGTDITSMLDIFSATLKGLVPASGGGTANFLRADGTWAAPPGGGGTDNANTGSGFRLLKPGTQEIKTLFNGYAVLMDSTTNANGITYKIDTSLIATRFAISALANIYNTSAMLTGNRTLSGNDQLYSLTFDSLASFTVKRAGVMRFQVTSTNTQIASPNTTAGISVNNSNALMSYSANALRVFADSTTSIRMIAYDYPFHSGLLTWFALTPKYYVDSLFTAAVAGGTQTLHQTLTAGNTSALDILLTELAGNDIFIQANNADGSGVLLGSLDQTGFVSIATNGAGTGTINAPASGSNSYFLPSASGTLALTSEIPTTEIIQDNIGLILVDDNTFNFTYNDGTPSITGNVITQMSITSDASGIKLSGDASTPGNTKYYGTDGSGTKGFFTFPATISAAWNGLITTTISGNMGSSTLNEQNTLVIHTGGTASTNLPTLASSTGYTMVLINQGTGDWTLNRQGSDNIFYHGANASSFVLKVGQTCAIRSMNGKWQVYFDGYDPTGGGGTTLASVGGGLDIQTGGAGNVRTLNTGEFSVATDLISVNAIAQSKITGLADSLLNKANKDGSNAYGNWGYYRLLSANNVTGGKTNFGSITSGADNFAIGNDLFNLTTSGNRNIAIGRNILRRVTTASDMISLGYQNFINVTTSLNSAPGISIGHDNNGYIKYKNLTIGAYNVGFLVDSTTSLTGVAADNMAIGVENLQSLRDGIDNMVFSWGGLELLDDGDNNLVFGQYGLPILTRGDNNNAFGHKAGYRLTSGYRNIFIGDSSGRGSGGLSATNSIFIGSNSRFTGSVRFNSIAIGDSALVSQDNLAVIGRAGTWLAVGRATATESIHTDGAIIIGDAVGTTDGTIKYVGGDFLGRKAGAWVSLTAGGGSGSPGGSSGEMQWNDAGSFNGTDAMVYATSGTHFTITPQATTDVSVLFQEISSQTADVWQVKNSGGTTIAKMEASGNTTLNGVTVGTISGVACLWLSPDNIAAGEATLSRDNINSLTTFNANANNLGLRVGNNTTFMVNITGNGKTGIGVTYNYAATAMLDVQAVNTSTEAIRAIGFEDGHGILGIFADDGDDAADKFFLRSDKTDNDLVFLNNTTEVFRIKNNGSIQVQTIAQDDAETKVVVWNSTDKIFEWRASSTLGGGSSTFAALTDVNLTSIATNDFLKWDGTDWINRTPANVRTDLGLVTGTDVQAYDADLTIYAGITPSSNVQTLLGAADYAAFKTSLSLNNVDNTSDATKNSATATITNKRITKRTGTVASSGTPTINTDNVDFYSITALAAAITSFTTNLSGTPTDGQTLWIAITDNGTARAIAWGASFEASTVPLPTTTVISTRLDVLFVWNAATSKWRCVAAQGYEWFIYLLAVLFAAIATNIEKRLKRKCA